MLAACGGSDDHDNNADAKASALEACNAQCEAQGKATGCTTDPHANVATCKILCGGVVSALSQDCLETAIAEYSCGSSADWACAPHSDLPVLPAAKCQTELNAYAECVAAKH